MDGCNAACQGHAVGNGTVISVSPRPFRRDASQRAGAAAPHPLNQGHVWLIDAGKRLCFPGGALAGRNVGR